MLREAPSLRCYTVCKGGREKTVLHLSWCLASANGATASSAVLRQITRRTGPRVRGAEAKRKTTGLSQGVSGLPACRTRRITLRALGGPCGGASDGAAAPHGAWPKRRRCLRGGLTGWAGQGGKKNIGKGTSVVAGTALDDPRTRKARKTGEGERRTSDRRACERGLADRRWYARTGRSPGS